MSDYQEESSSTHDLLPDEVEQFSKLAEEITSQFKEQHTPSAPPSDDNGYIVVPSQQQQPVATAAAESSPHEEDTVVLKKADASNAQSTTGCNTCPYYFLVEDLLLWKCPKYSGAVFGSTLVVLLSLATFTLLSVVSTLLLLALTGVGAYRFYLSVLFRIKGTYDDIFDKISSTDFSLPKDKIQELARLLDTDINRVINQLKSIILWDNLATSAVAYFVVYLVYCVASVFNTITLLILVHLAAFSLPKVYQVYKVQIDQTIQQATEFAHKTAEDIMAKLPFLKKKVQ